MQPKRPTRPSQSGPAHRRPSWARKDSDYVRWTYNSTSKKGIPGTDFGTDAFSYDPTQIEQWVIPNGLGQTMPQDLKHLADDLICAAAAVNTSLNRIAELHEAVIGRSHPKKTYGHLHSHADLSSSPAALTLASAPGVGSDTPPCSTPNSTTSTTNSAFPSTNSLALPTTLTFNAFKPTFVLDSPPMDPLGPVDSPSSPQSGFMENVFINQKIVTNYSALDLATKLATLPKLRSVSIPHDFDPTAYDPRAHELYLSCFKAEYDDLTQVVMPRLRGYARLIERHLAERSLALRLKSRAGAPEENKAVNAFTVWFAGQIVKVKEMEEQIEDVEWPELAEY